MIYRRAHQEPAWHFCQNCPRWPQTGFQEQTIEPQGELLCPDCTGRVKDLTCEVVPEPGIS